jgi:hypothetical protein
VNAIEKHLRDLPVDLEEIHAEAAQTMAARQRLEEKYGFKIYPVMGASPVGAPVEHPLGPPSVSNSQITVDMMLNQPVRITHMIMDLTLQRFVADRIFSSGGGVTGGAVIYDEVQDNELYLSRDVERVAPGGEFPLVTSERLVPKVAEVEKWGGKTYVTVEARDRNDSVMLTNRVRQLANTIVRKINQIAISKLEAAITAGSRTASGNNWSTVVTTGNSASNHSLWPAYDFAKAMKLAEEDELGISYNLWIINPQEYLALFSIYGDRLGAMLSGVGVSLYVSNRVTPGTAYVVASGQVGQMRVEQPLTTETWYENATQRNWIQSSVRPLMFVDNPYAVLKFTGLAG